MSSIPNRGPTLVAVNTTFMVAAFIANALRCYVRIRMVKGFGLDDYLMAIATLSFITYGCFSNVGTGYGTGRHHRDLEVHNVVKAVNCWWYCYLFYCITMITSKLSIGFFLLRIAVKRLHTWIVYGAMAISLGVGIVFFFVTIFQCSPVPYYWDKWDPTKKGTCINIEVVIGLGYLYSAFSIISDFIFALLPAFIVMGLQLDKRTKMALVPLLTMGCVASSGVFVRTPFFHHLRSKDFLWDTVEIALWSTVEMGLAITAGSLATLRPLFSIFLRSIGLTSGRNTSRRTPSKYGLGSPSASRILDGPSTKRKHSHMGLSGYDMHTFTETVCERESIDAGTRKKGASATVYGDSESQKSLKGSDGDSLHDMDGNGMRIMVEKSFVHEVSEPSPSHMR